MKLLLCDTNPEVVKAWQLQFERHSEVQVREGSIFEAEAEGFVIPGNTFGFLDRGLGLKACERFGFELEDAIRKVIRETHGGELLVGQAEVFPTGGNPPYLIYAPTFRTPQGIGDTLNVYLAARGVFRAAQALNRDRGGEAIKTVAFPGLGTGTGKMHPLISARQIRYAYEEIQGLRKIRDQNLSRLIRREKKLKELPRMQGEEESTGGSVD